MNSSYPLVFSVTSGKGGVGKTNISVNLALTLAARGKRVLLLDADLGLANVDVLLGLHPEKNIFHLFHEGTIWISSSWTRARASTTACSISLWRRRNVSSS